MIYLILTVLTKGKYRQLSHRKFQEFRQSKDVELEVIYLNPKET